jgi:hypothetical protein
MTATTATDISGVEYYFDCTSHPIYSSVWQDSPIYTRSGLPPDVYTFVVRARDKSPIQNTTGDSTAVTVDLEPPTPSPMQWYELPHDEHHGGGGFDWWAVMESVVATDAYSGFVEYRFICSNGTYSSGWQTSPHYEAWTQTPGLTVTFQVKARDLFGNETALSTPPAPLN